MSNFAKWLAEQEEGDNKGNIFAPPLNAQQAVNFLIDYLLGEDWYVSDPVGAEQVNSEAVDSILLKYCKRRYRKEIKIEREKWRKRHEN